jgi:hypothetical protein
VMGLCALMIVVVASAAQARPTAQSLARHVKTLEKDKQVIRFFEQHRWLLRDSAVGLEARRQLRLHRLSLSRHQQHVVRLRARLVRETATRQLQALQKAGPRRAICHVFGSRYCGEALRVARCESHLKTSAHNGQYLGLFQMGTSERHRFGHGGSAYRQAQAAHRYFVVSGRDWSPWSCKPWW